MIPHPLTALRSVFWKLAHPGRLTPEETAAFVQPEPRPQDGPSREEERSVTIRCEQRAWTAEDELRDAPDPTGPQCENKAEFIHCSDQSKVCAKHKCRHNTPIFPIERLTGPTADWVCNRCQYRARASGSLNTFHRCPTCHLMCCWVPTTPQAPEQKWMWRRIDRANSKQNRKDNHGNQS